MDVPSYYGLNAVITDQNIYKIYAIHYCTEMSIFCSVGLRENVI